jgi:hypothetical protein
MGPPFLEKFFFEWGKKLLKFSKRVLTCICLFQQPFVKGVFHYGYSYKDYGGQDRQEDGGKEDRRQDHEARGKEDRDQDRREEGPGQEDRDQGRGPQGPQALRSQEDREVEAKAPFR